MSTCGTTSAVQPCPFITGYSDILIFVTFRLDKRSMDPPPKPKPALKLRLGSFTTGSASSPQSQPTTPGGQTPQRTPSIKLSFGKKSGATSSIPPTPSDDGATPSGSTKKRKRTESTAESVGKPELKRPPTVLKLFTKHNPTTVKNVASTPGIKLKTKGKIPRRAQGVGYDSELEDREHDPVILEGLVIRMLPGEDCTYIRDCIANGTVGISILQNGADIRLRFLDVYGRRGILTVRGRQYAFSVVDLPTITEGMKSWDRKNFIKSIDISQLLLVLGRCQTDEEARNYPLPPDIDPKSYKYAHGLTAPMRNVRKRRFERTARTRLDDLEAIERKVNQLFEADERASEVRHEVLGYDPRQEEVSEQDSEDDAEGDEDEDGEGEEEEEGEDYFQQNGYLHAPEPDHTAEDISALEAMLEAEDDDLVNTSTAATQQATDVDSSAAPSPRNMETPAHGAPPPGPEVDGDDDADDDDEDDAGDASDQEASDEKEETMVKIREAEDKIAQQKEQLKRTTNQIIRKKIAKKVQALESDVKMMKRHAGLRQDDGDGEGDADGEEVAQSNSAGQHVIVTRLQEEESGSEEE